MRWESQELNVADPAALLPLAGLVRSVKTPDFAGVTFHEVLCKSALNRVPEKSAMPFRWTINPTRGCLHQCTYCFARRTHEYLDLDSGADFDTQIVVKTNVSDVLRKELARASWKREHVALGTNSDPYMRAEGRYALMPGIITALAESGTPFSILTKGSVLRRDLPLLVEAAKVVPVSVSISLALIDPELQRSVEPGTPTPKARLDLIRAVSAAGIDCAALAMPILPWLSDSDEQIDALFSALAEAGAVDAHAGPLNLVPGAREWYLAWLAREHPHLVARYRRIYGNGLRASAEYREWLRVKVRAARARHGFVERSRNRHSLWRSMGGGGGVGAEVPAPAVVDAAPAPAQLALF